MTATEMNAILTELIRGKWDESKCRYCGKLWDGEWCSHICEVTLRTRQNTPKGQVVRYLDYADSPIDFATPTGFVMALEWAARAPHYVRIFGDETGYRVGFSVKSGDPFFWHEADSPAVALRAALVEARERGLL